MSWITSLYFCRTENVEEKKQLGSNGGFREPFGTDLWWPQTLGPETENIGNILVLKTLPITIQLGLHLVAYGNGLETLKIQIFGETNPDRVLLEYKNKIKFDLLKPEQLPGVVSLNLAVTNFKVEQSGLYWLAAITGRSNPTRLPLYIVSRNDLAED